MRVGLWRALHVEIDPPPHILEDEVGLKLAAPDEGWRGRLDMSPFARPFRAAIVARARFIEDVVAEQAARGAGQYVILGAGLDTFAQRRPQLASRLLVLEVDRPGPQAWKRQRLIDLGFGIPRQLLPSATSAAGPMGFAAQQLRRVAARDNVVNALCMCSLGASKTVSDGLHLTAASAADSMLQSSSINQESGQ